MAGDDAVLALIPGNSRTSNGVLLGVYRHAYVARLVEVVRAAHPLLAAYMGDDAFEAMARRYVAGHPSRQPNARWFAAHVPDFLGEPPFDAAPWLGEIALIERWLSSRGEPLPDHADHVMMAPGMLTTEQMDRLRAARGEEFDRLFLESMIQHHEGAITMVRTLFATSGSAQDSEIFQFANDVETDQRIEIDRMRQLLEQGGGR